MIYFILIEHCISVEKSSLCKQIYYSLNFTKSPPTHTHTCTRTHTNTRVFNMIYIYSNEFMLIRFFIGMNCISDNMKGENNRLLDGMSSTNLKKYLDKSI